MKPCARRLRATHAVPHAAKPASRQLSASAEASVGHCGTFSSANSSMCALQSLAEAKALKGFEHCSDPGLTFSVSISVYVVTGCRSHIMHGDVVSALTHKYAG